jgi:hypothetical protein
MMGTKAQLFTPVHAISLDEWLLAGYVGASIARPPPDWYPRLTVQPPCGPVRRGCSRAASPE